MRWRLASAVTLLGFALASPDQAMAAGKLSNIFKVDMLNAELADLERITGPATQVIDFRGVQMRDYRVDGCKMQAFVRGTMVRRYSLSLTPSCNLDLAALVPGHGSTKDLTVGKFVGGTQHPVMRFHADCMDCGNAADPTADFIWTDHAANVVTVELTTVIAGANPAALEAFERLQNLMRDKEGADYLEATTFNCDGKYDDAAVRTFSQVPVNQIVIGFADSDARCP
jgi:hypothetical protein